MRGYVTLMIKLPLDIQNFISGAVTPGKDKVWGTGRPTLRKWQGKSLNKMHNGVRKFFKKQMIRRARIEKKKIKQKRRTERGRKIAENEDEEGEIKR